MKVLFISIFLAAGLIIFGGVSSFANETTGGSANKGRTEEIKGSTNQGATGEMTQGTTVINGKIADIQSDTVKIKDEKGNFQSIKLSSTEELENLRAQDLKVGDRVHAEMKDGKLVSLYKAGSSGNMKEGMKGENMKSNTSATNTKKEEGTTAGGKTAAGSSQTEETNGNTQSMNENMEGTARSKQYTVKKGDTLAKIAQKTLGSSAKWREIARLNVISDPNTIRVGQHLTLPQTARNTSESEEGASGTMEERTKGMKGNTGTIEEGTKGNTETAPEQAAPNPEEGKQPLKNQDND